MIDYIELSKCLCKDTPNLSSCNPYHCRLNDYGWQTYTLHGCRGVQVHYKGDSNILRVRGSLPYFLKGHNFTFTNEEYIESINLLQYKLCIGLWDACVNVFEFGAIMQVPLKPELYIQKHTALPNAKLNENYKGKDNDAFKWWDSSKVTLKLYDAGKNIKMKQGLDARKIIEAEGYRDCNEYIKFEAHFKKPHLLNGHKDILVEDLQNPEWQNKLGVILVGQYKQLKPMADLIKPTDKKNYNALDIVFGEYVKELMDKGRSIQEAKKILYGVINNTECLNQSDKNARKQTIRKTISKLQVAEHSQWDLTEQLEEALQVN